MSSQHIRFRTCHQLDTALFLPELQRCSSHFNRLPTSHFNRLHFTALAITSFHGSHTNKLGIICISSLCPGINRLVLAFLHLHVFDRTALACLPRSTHAKYFQAVAKSRIAPSNKALMSVFLTFHHDL